METILYGISAMFDFNIKELKALIKTANKEELYEEIGEMIGANFAFKYCFIFQSKAGMIGAIPEQTLIDFFLNIVSALNELEIGIQPLLMYRNIDSGIVRKTHSIIYPVNSEYSMQFIQNALSSYQLFLAKVMATYYKDVYLLYTKNLPLCLVSHISGYLYDRPF